MLYITEKVKLKEQNLVSNMDIKDIQIIKASTLDLDKLVALEESLDKNILSLSSISNMLSSNTSDIYIAKFGNKVIGYIALDILVDHIDLCSIAVKKEYRRFKVGTMLLNKLYEIALDLKIQDIFLEVRTSNIAAIAFYECNGFKKISVRKNYYKDSFEDAVIYKQELV